MQKVVDADELCGVALGEDARRSAAQRGDTDGIAANIIERLDTRFQLDTEIVAATSIANLSNWPQTLNEAKGMQTNVPCWNSTRFCSRFIFIEGTL